MQDRTINNALIALYRRRGEQAELAEQLLRMRGQKVPRRQDRPFETHQASALALSMLPCTTSEIADRVQELVPGLSRALAVQRAYMTVLRLERKGKARREGRMWFIVDG